MKPTSDVTCSTERSTQNQIFNCQVNIKSGSFSCVGIESRKHEVIWVPMLTKKLLLSGILLILAQSLKGTVLATGLPHILLQDNSQTRSRPLFTNQPFSLQSSRQNTSQINAQSASPVASFHSPLLSSLILPLPPLIIPELLLPPYDFPSFNSHRLDQELRLYSQYLRTFGTPDVLLVGSSRSLQGIDPIALQGALANRGYPGLKVFNFGINGGTAKVNDLLLRRILTLEQLPRLIIWGDGSRAFNEGREDITYNGIAASEGYRRLAMGDRPIPSRIVAERQALALRTVANKSAIHTSRSAIPEQPIARDLDANGFEAVSQRFDPATYYRQYSRVPGNYDADYLDFHLWGEQTEATIATATFARRHKITLVFVNLPLTQDYLDPIRRNDEQQFRQHMQQMAEREQFIFRDFSQFPELMQHGYFADPSHINRYGAEAIALQLAADPVIPWHILRFALEEGTAQRKTKNSSLTN